VSGWSKWFSEDNGYCLTPCPNSGKAEKTTMWHKGPGTEGKRQRLKTTWHTGCPIIVWARFCNLRFSKLDRDIKILFGYDVPILVDYTYAKNEPSVEHVGSGEMSEWEICANCVKIRICRKNYRLLAVFNITLLKCIFSLQFVYVHLSDIFLHIL
jgi:hypothetical protein